MTLGLVNDQEVIWTETWQWVALHFHTTAFLTWVAGLWASLRAQIATFRSVCAPSAVKKRAAERLGAVNTSSREQGSKERRRKKLVASYIIQAFIQFWFYFKVVLSSLIQQQDQVSNISNSEKFGFLLVSLVASFNTPSKTGCANWHSAIWIRSPKSEFLCG